MKVVVSSSGDQIESQVSPVFGRCTYFVLVDTESMQATALPNPAMGASGGAGVQSAQYVVQQGAQAVVSGNVGPNAMQVLLASGISVYCVEGGTVRQAVEALNEAKLEAVELPTVGRDHGKGGSGTGTSSGRGGRGFGRGAGRSAR